MPAHGVHVEHLHEAGRVRIGRSIDADELRRIIRALGPDRLVSARDWVARAADGCLRSDEVCLTFDNALPV
jgi:hypothetical protein